MDESTLVLDEARRPRIFLSRWGGLPVCVYLLRDGHTDAFKVGLSKDPQARLRQIMRESARTLLAIVRETWLDAPGAWAMEQELKTAVWRHRATAATGWGTKVWGSAEWFFVPHHLAFDLYDAAVEKRRSSGLLPAIQDE